MAALSGRRRKFTTQSATTYVLDNYFSFQNCTKESDDGSVFLANSHLIAENQHNQIVRINAQQNNSKM